MTSKAQQSTVDNTLVAPKNQRIIGKCNMRINPRMKPNEPTYQVVLDALALTTCYHAFLITAEVPCSEKFSTYVLGFQVKNLMNPHLKRTFASIINKCLCGKVSGLDKIRLSIVQILWGMYYKKNLDFIALIWEDLVYQIDNKNSKKQDKMFYPRFTKIIIHHFLDKDKSISMRNRTFMANTLERMTAYCSQAMMDSVAYKTYYAIAIGAEPLKSKKPKRKSDSTISFEETPSKKKPTKANKDGDSGEEDDDDKDATKDDECNDDGNDSDDDDDNDGDDNDGDDDDNDGDDDDDDNDGNDDYDSDHERTKSDRDENPNINQSNEEHEEEEEYDDKFANKEYDANYAKEENEEELDDAEELYKDVNVNLRKEDVEMTDADQGGEDQHNISQELGFEHEEEDAHVTLTAVHDVQKTEGPMQSSSVSSNFIEKLLNFENVSPADNEIASLMDTTVHHEEPSGQTSSLYTVPLMVIPKITSTFTTTIPPPPPSFNPLLQQNNTNSHTNNLRNRYIDNKQRKAIQQAIKSHTAECREEDLTNRREYKDLIDTSVRAIIKEEANS
ncbi:hypothetical protein Tco_0614810 [Tanacetum coccineum]